MRSHADGASEDPPVEIVITIADGASMQGTKEHLNGEPANLSGATVTKRDKLNSGESFTPWNFRIDGARTEASMVNGKVVVMLYGPGTITYSRSKVKQ